MRVVILPPDSGWDFLMMIAGMSQIRWNESLKDASEPMLRKASSANG
jgi:hypothetical protein